MKSKKGKPKVADVPVTIQPQEANNFGYKALEDMPNATRPEHYGGESNPHEPIKIIEHYGLGFHLGNAIKYILRAGAKHGESKEKDLKKAIWYIERYLQKN